MASGALKPVGALPPARTGLWQLLGAALGLKQVTEGCAAILEGVEASLPFVASVQMHKYYSEQKGEQNQVTCIPCVSPEKQGFFFLAVKWRREHGETMSMISASVLPWLGFCLVLRPGRCQDLLLVTAQAPCGIQPQRRGSSTRAGEPDPVSIRPQMARERRGDPSKPSNSLFSQFDIPARAGAGGSGEQRALTGSSQLSSKKLQFCKQSSAAPLGLAGKGLGPPHPIHRRTCRSREKSISVSTSTSERNGSAGRKGTGRQRHCWAPAAAASQGHS